MDPNNVLCEYPTTDSLLQLLTFLGITSRHGPRRKHRSLLLQFKRFRGNVFVWEAATQQRSLYIFLSRGRCPATGLHATISEAMTWSYRKDGKYILTTRLEDGTLDVQEDDEQKNSICLRSGHGSIFG
jgi:hypothetical protein